MNRLAAGIQRSLRSLDEGYERLITWALRRRALVVGLALTLLLVSVGSVLLLGTEFLPVADEGNFSIDFTTREGASAEFTLSKARRIESIVRDVAGDDLRALSGAAGGAAGAWRRTRVRSTRRSCR